MKMNKEPQSNKNTKARTGLEIAVIGMAGRFPGARNIDEFWNNLKEGKETLSFFSDEELEDLGKRTDIVRHPHYVPSKGGVLEEQEYFDARFFDYTPLEAEIMDPQIRLFHECCWEALEDAGYAPDSYRGNIGLYAGNSTNFNWEGTILLSGKGRELGEFAADQLTVRDFLTTRVSYKLNLKGPSLLIQTACSTSLVAIHTACRALLTGDCKVALAGGVTVEHLNPVGYIFQEGMIMSPDGHCRAFDAEAKGTVFGSGVGVVVLKPLKEATADRDHIYAVVKGSAVNNDGLRKVGYSAPSVKGQVEVIRTALRFSRVEPESITYVETHGTGTELGDPIEIEALTQAFNTNKRCYCGIGSVKTNVGHLDAAAGVASFIKTVLALKHKCIPPSLHFKTPNPKIDFENSPFYVNAEPSEWKTGKYPLRAGVSSLGIGGTNAHVILEEPPVIDEEKGECRRKYQLILLSAKSQSALDKMTENLCSYLKEDLLNPADFINSANPGFNLSDAAYTLQVGRKEFPSRKMAVCSTLENTIDTLSSPVSENVQTFITNEESQSVVFMFPGQGSQYVNMGLEIYKTEPLFREEMDRCFDMLKPILGYDIKEILYPDEATKTLRHQDRGVSIGSPRRGVNQTEIIQPLLFIFEYSLAKLLIKWGITPYAMIGHSIGEYVAACLSGVISLDSALKLVSYRGKLIQKLPTGSMLSVSLPGKELIPLLNEDTALAAVNSPSYRVVSGPHEAIDAFEELLKKKGYQGRRLHTSHAFHSKMMEPILKEFEEMVKHVKLNKPEIPFISNISGNWIRPEEAIEPGYWARHMRKTVRFWDGIDLLMKKEETVFVEVGPGRTLSTFLRQHQQEKCQYQIVNMVRHPQEEYPDDYFLLSKIGQLWLYNLKINWQKFHNEENRHRISLPTYPFESVRYWIDEDPSKINARILPEKSLFKKPDIADWFYIPSWIRSPLTDDKNEKSIVQTRWLIFMDEGGLGSRLVRRLEKIGHEVVEVRAGSEFIKEKDKAFRINPGLEDDYDSLLKELSVKEKIPGKIIHLWGVTGNDSQGSIMKKNYADLSRSLDMGIYSLFYLTRAIGNNEIEEDIKIEVVTDNMQEVTGEEHLRPEKATLLGPVKVIPLEYSNIKCRSIDIIIPGSGEGHNEKLINQLLAEFATESANPVIAYRGNHRWEQTFKPVQLKKSKKETSRLRKEGVYLVTGGLGGIGLEIAEYLVKRLRARLILTGRSPFPGRESWKEWLDNHEKNNHISRKIRKVQELEEFGDKVLIFSADVTHYEQMLEVVSQAENQFGKITGVIHASGVPGGGVIPLQTREKIEDTLNSKVRGTLVLNRTFNDTQLDCFILCSSGDSILPGYGQVDYCAANTFLDAFANYNTSEKGKVTTAINWGRWKNTGMAAAVEPENPKVMENEPGNGMTAQEALEAFDRILETTLPQVIVNETDFTIMVEQFNTFSALDTPRDPELAQALEVEEKEAISRGSYPGPGLSTEYAAPGNETEEKMAHTWQRFFGYERVGINDDFFELGGDSLKAVMLMTKIHQEFDVKVSLTALFRNPTIKKIAAYIEKKEKEKFTSIPKAPKKDYYALSSAQKRLFIIQQKELHSTVYNLTQWIILEEGTDIHRLEQTFMKLIKRHESLRTSFETINGEPVQKIYKEVDFKIEYDEVSNSLTSYRQVLPLTSQFIRPFDLSRAPLMRASVVKTEDRKLLLLVDMHHIISDEVSQDILMQDFMPLYEGEEIPELRLQYKDYSEWQNKIHFQGQESEELKQQEEFWLKEFEGRIPILNLPIDNVRPEKRSFETGAIEFEMRKEETKTLKELVKREGVTMFMLLLAVINVLLSKICGQEDIVIGTPTAGRRHADLDMIMGMFVNFLALRNYPSPGKTFKEFLKEVKKQTVHAFENQDYQFENLVEKLKLKRTTGRNPLFDGVFSFHNIEGLAEETGEIGSSNIKNEKEQTNLRYRTAFYDVVFHAYEAKENISFTFQYSTTLFKKETIENFIDYFKAIVSFVIKCLEIKISEIEIISEEQKKRLIEKIRKAKGKFFAADARIKKEQIEDIKADFNF